MISRELYSPFRIHSGHILLLLIKNKQLFDFISSKMPKKHADLFKYNNILKNAIKHKHVALIDFVLKNSPIRESLINELVKLGYPRLSEIPGLIADYVGLPEEISLT